MNAPRLNELRGLVPDRIFSLIRDDGDHWIWTGKPTKKGYGQAWALGRTRLVHRLVWQVLGFPLAADEDLHHVCLEKLCCNPAHCMPLTKAAHIAEHHGEACIHGHEFTVENTYWRQHPDGHQTRCCRRCFADRQMARWNAMTVEERHIENLANSERRRQRKARARAIEPRS